MEDSPSEPTPSPTTLTTTIRYGPYIVNLSTNKQEGYEWVKRFNDGYHSFGLKVESGIVGKSWADYLLLGLIASTDKNNVQTGSAQWMRCMVV